MTSKERVLSTLDGRAADYAPLCVLLFPELQRRCRGEEEFLLRQLELGMDAMAVVPEPAMGHHPEVRQEVWEEPARPNPLLHKVYRTPEGELHTIVQKTADWPHGRQVPLMSDHVIPRARKFLVTGPEDLPALRYVLGEVDSAGLGEFRAGASAARRLAEKHRLALRGGFNRLSDMVCWLCGCEAFATMGLTDPEFFQALIDLIAGWQERRIEVVLQAGLDVLVDPQWYATTFLSPSLYERFLAPAMRRRIEMTHAAGARFCTVATANVLPFAHLLKGLGIDALFGVDPIQGAWDLRAAKADLGGQVCLWGGVNAYLTVVDGRPADVRRAVEQAMAVLAPGGRFILSPVDAIRIDSEDPDARWPAVWDNVRAMVDAWKRVR